MGIHVPGERGQSAIRHADRDGGHVFERIWHGEQEDVHTVFNVPVRLAKPALIEKWTIGILALIRAGVSIKIRIAAQANLSVRGRDYCCGNENKARLLVHYERASYGEQQTNTLKLTSLS